MAAPTKDENAFKTGSIEFLNDVTLAVAVEFGRVQTTVRQILSWKPGTVLVLNKQGGEPLDFLANGNRVAAGEAVIVNDKFGVRITQVLDPQGLQLLADDPGKTK